LECISFAFHFIISLTEIKSLLKQKGSFPNLETALALGWLKIILKKQSFSHTRLYRFSFTLLQKKDLSIAVKVFSKQGGAPSTPLRTGARLIPIAIGRAPTNSSTPDASGR
jgi:hypothetical protein